MIGQIGYALKVANELLCQSLHKNANWNETDNQVKHAHKTGKYTSNILQLIEYCNAGNLGTYICMQRVRSIASDRN